MVSPELPELCRRAAVTAFFVLLLSVLFVSQALCQPVIFWACDPVRPDETVLVAGSGFSTDSRVRITAIPAGDPGFPSVQLHWPANGQVLQPEPLQPTGESLKFIVPPSFEDAVYLFRIEDKGKQSRIRRLNGPTIYWMQGDTGISSSSPGGWLSIFGRCVGRSKEHGLVVLQKKDSIRIIQLIPEIATPWRVHVELPDNIEPGRWQVFVHNGLGGRMGWTRGGTLLVRKKEGWPGNSFNVKEFGASGQGKPEDFVAVRRAIQAAADAGGGTVFFPRGRYRMDGPLVLPRFVRLAGEATELVSIYWPDTENPYILVQGRDHFSIQDLTIYASNYRAVIAGDIMSSAAGHVTLRRLRVRADLYRGHLTLQQVMQRQAAAQKLSSGGPDTVRLGGPGIVIVDCDLYGAGRSIYLHKARGAVVRRNKIYNGRWGWYSLSGSDGLIFEYNQITGADLMSTGGGINCLAKLPYSRNVYFAHNRLAHFNGWDREAVTTDGPGAAYFGHVSAVNGREMVLVNRAQWKTHDWEGAGVFILEGRGMGQYREIAGTGSDGHTVLLDQPWDVAPDSSSRITIAPMQRNYLFIENRFEDAGVALQYYGTSINTVASGNVAVRAGGFYNSGRWYHGFQPTWYCQFLGNTIAEGNGYRFGPNNSVEAGESYLGTLGLRNAKVKPLLAYGAIHRGNILKNNAGIRILGYNEKHPGVRNVLVEYNLVENSDTGIFVDHGARRVLVRKNRIQADAVGRIHDSLLE